MDSVSGSLTDSSGNGFNGTLSAGWSATTGVTSGAGQLNGAAYATARPGTPATWTINQWVNVRNMPTSGIDALSTLGNGSASYTGWEVFVAADGRPGVYIETTGTGSGERMLYGTEAICTGDWAMVTVTWEAGTLMLYVDGEYVSGATYTGASIVYGTLPFAVGYDPNQSIRYLDGALDEVGLWDVALNGDEIAQLFEDGACHRSSL